MIYLKNLWLATRRITNDISLEGIQWNEFKVCRMVKLTADSMLDVIQAIEKVNKEGYYLEIWQDGRGIAYKRNNYNGWINL